MGREVKKLQVRPRVGDLWMTTYGHAVLICKVEDGVEFRDNNLVHCLTKWGIRWRSTSELTERVG